LGQGNPPPSAGSPRAHSCGPHLVAARGNPWRPTSMDTPQHQVCTNFVAAADHECLSGCVKPFPGSQLTPRPRLPAHALATPTTTTGAPRPSTASYARARERSWQGRFPQLRRAPAGRPSNAPSGSTGIEYCSTALRLGTHPSGDTAVSGSTGAPSSRPFSEIRGLPLPVARSRGLTRTVLRVTGALITGSMGRSSRGARCAAPRRYTHQDVASRRHPHLRWKDGLV